MTPTELEEKVNRTLALLLRLEAKVDEVRDLLADEPIATHRRYEEHERSQA